jgi:RNA polymerase sigma-70 factor (ECF subfamily)
MRNWMRVAGRLPGFTLRPAEVNGGAGVVATDGDGRLISVWSLEISDGQIHSIRSVVNPDKLAHLGAVADFAALTARIPSAARTTSEPHDPGDDHD